MRRLLKPSWSGGERHSYRLILLDDCGGRSGRRLRDWRGVLHNERCRCADQTERGHNDQKHFGFGEAWAGRRHG
jgi:hypothetical protein